jgi:FAD:protein FMN transferase
MERRTFRAMGTEIELLVDASGAAAALSAAESEFHRLEEILSRFRPESELSLLNRAGRLDAGPDLLRVTELALAAREDTGGRFDPTVHAAVVAAGYDRTFESIAADGPQPWIVEPGVAEPGAVACGGAVRIHGGAIELDDGVRLDFGGIGKGYAADRAAEVLAIAGPCLVNAGGDIAVRDGAWPIAVQTATGSLTVELTSGALATSGRDRRRWQRGGRELHHIIDPATGTSADGDLDRITVVASDAVAAEVWAKALFLAGEEAGAAEADLLRLPSVFVSTSGTTRFAGGLR